MTKPLRSKLTTAIFFFLLFITPNALRAEQKKNSSQITVFCTNNKDGTGSCLTSSQKPVECILIPGSVVECTDEGDNELACILVHSTSAIVEISCEKSKAAIQQVDIIEIPSMSEELKPEATANNNRVSDRSESTSEADLTTPDRPLLEDAGESPFADPF